ncbi:hypothetical protein NX059_004059 [Plenodomus lindquistii]|nr:hypothetical protein NX059_004059 [Plenodomus lindquistii]
MSPRNSSSQSDAGPQRLPFAAAEALLWGPEMKKQHQWLLQQMRELHSQHEAYDARIQTTEAIAEAAEAATARIRLMEQQLTAMEAVDKENAFEKWAVAEINQLKAFKDDNKNLRQKQIELDKEVAGLTDDVDKVRQVPHDLESLHTRVEMLSSRQKEDADRIKALEREIASLRSASGRQPLTSMQTMRQPVPPRQPSYQRVMTPPRKTLVVGDDESSETEDEDLFVLPRIDAQLGSEKVDVPASSDTEKALDNLVEPSPTKLPPTETARQRLFKRPSIHNSKLPRLLEEIQRQERAGPDGPQHRAAPVPPPTQLVHRGSPHKHNPSVDNDVIPRSAPQVRSPHKVREQPGTMKHTMKSSEQPTQLVNRRPANPRKRVVDVDPPSLISEDISKQPTQLVAISPRKKPRITAPKKSNQETGVASPGPGTANSPKKRLVVVLQTQFADTQIKKSDLDDTQQNAAESVKTSPRKTAAKGRTCIPCTQRHRACNKAQPACGQCVKRSQGHACVYPPAHDALVRSKKPVLASPQKKVLHDSTISGPGRSSKRVDDVKPAPSHAVSPRKRIVRANAVAGPSQLKAQDPAARNDESPSTRRTISPEQPPSSLRPREAKTRAAAAILTNSTRPRRRPVPDTTDLDFDTFLKMKKENPKF